MPPNWFHAAAGALSGAVLVAGPLVCGYAVAASIWTRKGDGHVRLAATSVLAATLGAVWFLLGTALGVFSFPVTLAGFGCAAVGCAAVAGRRGSLGESLRMDATSLGWTFRDVLSGPGRWLAWPVLLVAVVRTGRSLISPPMATDALVYHLPRAVHWVQSGRRTLPPAPDVWGYVAYYPPLGDAVWSYGLFADPGGAWLGPLNALIWLGTLGGCWLAARRLGISTSRAWLCAGAIASLPAVLGFLGACYVDTAVLGLVALSVALIPTAGDRGFDVRLGLALTALALAAGVKATALPVLGLGLAYGVVVAKRGGRWGGYALGALAAGGLLAASYAPGWIDHGNPLYPFGLEIGPWRWAGNVENTSLHRGDYAPDAVKQFSWAHLLNALFLPRTDWRIPHLNFGPVTAILVPVGLVGSSWGLVRHRKHRLEYALVLLLVVVFALRLAGAESLAHRTFFAPSLGRLLLLPVACTIGAAAASLELRAVDWLLGMGIVVGSVLSAPVGLAPVEVGGVFVGTLVSICVVGVPLGLAWFGHGRLAAVLAALAVLVAGPIVGTRRAELRTPVWQAGIAALAFDPHPTDEKAMLAAPLWAHLDGEPGVRIAFTAGWDGIGHNGYRFPLYGSRLQNEIVYVPVTSDRVVVDYARPEALVGRLDESAWLERLEHADVDYLFIAAPPRTPELEWVQAHPERFGLVGRAGNNLLFSVRAERRPG